uniref:Uncharacterized protein n=1 Tax=candidate division CPR3 bacterium TaxID=2268181 RepID=A0A7C4M040_UNCC3
MAVFLSIILLILQIIFAFLMKNKKEAFLKYHKILGIFILLIVLANLILFPINTVVSILVVVAVLAQVIIGFLLKKGNKKLKKYHKPLGFFILVLIITNLILIFP